IGDSGRPPSPFSIIEGLGSPPERASPRTATFGAPRRSRGAPLYRDTIVRARWWLRRGRDDAHVAVALAPLEANDAIDLGEERVIGPAPDVHPGLERRPPLANEDAASGHQLTGEALDPQHLGIGIPAVSRAADAFLVSHSA